MKVQTAGRRGRRPLQRSNARFMFVGDGVLDVPPPRARRRPLQQGLQQNRSAASGGLGAARPTHSGIVAAPRVGLCVGRDAHIAPQSAVPSGIGVTVLPRIFRYAAAYNGPMRASAPTDKGIVAAPRVGFCVGRDAHIAPQSAVLSGIGVTYYRAFSDMLLPTTGRRGHRPLRTMPSMPAL